MEGLNQQQGSRPEQMPGYYYQPPLAQYGHNYIPYPQAQPYYIPPPPPQQSNKQYKRDLRRRMWESKSTTGKIGTVLMTCILGFFLFTMCITLLSMCSGSSNNDDTTPASDTSTARIADNPNAPEHWFD